MTLPVYVLNGPNLNLLGQPRARSLWPANAFRHREDGRTARQEAGLETSSSGSRTTKASWSTGSRRRGPRLGRDRQSRARIPIPRSPCSTRFKALDKPIIEVHLSNPHQREPFRHHSYVSSVAKGVIMGLGSIGYVMAIDAMAALVGTGKATLQ